MTTPLNLAELTTFRVGGTAAEHTTVKDSAALTKAVAACDEAGTPVLLVGGGSNMLVGDGPVDQHVIVVRSTGFDHTVTGGSVHITAQAGVVWDDFVAHCVGNGWAGVEALSGIPGCVGATPIQNVGAYGQDVAQTITAVRVWDRTAGTERSMTPDECEFRYRDSVFKRNPDAYVVLDVTFGLTVSPDSEIAYSQLASALGKEIGDTAPVQHIRKTVVEVRASKGMVLDSTDHDTWSAGSFFTNPIVQQAQIPGGAPSFPVGDDGMAKTSAAWLIDNAGFTRGFGLPGPASLSTKHTLALTNRGTAKASDIVELAATVRDGVEKKYGIRLVPEPNFINCTLPD